MVAVAAVALLAAAAAGWLLLHKSSKPAAQTAAAVASHVTASLPAPGALYRSAISAAATQSSVHVHAVFVGKGHNVVFDDTDGRTSGEQLITADGHHAEVRVVGSATYFRADDAALHNYFDFSTALVKRYHGHWVKLTRANSAYEAVTDAVTLSSALKQIDVEPPFSAVPASVKNGVAVVGVRGQVAGSGGAPQATVVLWVAAAAPHLPVAYTATAAGGLSESVTFSGWSHPVAVAAPTAWLAASNAPAARSAAVVDADVRSELRNLATMEETYLTDNNVYATAAQLHASYPEFRVTGGERVVVHLNKQQGYCLAGRISAARWWIYSSLEGGLSGPATSDTCNAGMYPTSGGTLG